MPEQKVGKRYVVEYEGAWAFEAGAITDTQLARIYEVKEGWPKRNAKPVITLGGPEPTRESAAEQVRIWFAADCPLPAQLKETADA